MKVRKERMAEYKMRHEAVWPEMLDALRRHGWRNYSLFLTQEGLLFGYFEAERSFQASLDGMASEDVNTRWQTFMAEYFGGIPGLPDESMVQLEQVFYLE